MLARVLAEDKASWAAAIGAAAGDTGTAKKVEDTAGEPSGSATSFTSAPTFRSAF